MKYEQLKQKYKDFIIIQKQGIFYMVYGNDSYIINYLFDYQIKQYNKTIKVGFSNIDKVIKKLNKLKINYIVNNEIKKKFKNNNYDKYSINNITKMNKILSKIKDIILDENKINEIEKIL